MDLLAIKNKEISSTYTPATPALAPNVNKIIKSLPDKCISLVLEDPDLLDCSEACECLLKEFLSETIGDASAVDGAVGGGALVVHFIKCERLRIG